MIRIILTEMAYARAKAIEKISSLQLTIIEHLIKYFLMPKYRAKNHWKREIMNTLKEIYRWSTNIKSDKSLKCKDIYNVFIKEPLIDTKIIIQIIRDINIEYKTEFEPYAYKTILFNKFELFFTEFGIGVEDNSMDSDIISNLVIKYFD